MKKIVVVVLSILIAFVYSSQIGEAKIDVNEYEENLSIIQKYDLPFKQVKGESKVNNFNDSKDIVEEYFYFLLNQYYTTNHQEYKYKGDFYKELNILATGLKSSKNQEFTYKKQGYINSTEYFERVGNETSN